MDSELEKAIPSSVSEPSRRLYHFPISPASRMARLLLGELKSGVQLQEERYWSRSEDLLSLNPAGEVPVLREADGEIYAGAAAVIGYLCDLDEGRTFLPVPQRPRAEVRRLTEWFTVKFAAEVSTPLIEEKVVKRFLDRAEGGGPPAMPVVRAALHNLRYHLDYICYLMEHRNWLAGSTLSLADLAAAAHLSCLDYVGDVPWNQYPEAKEWYVRLKSRPSFRPLLADHLPGMPPPKAYADLDF